MTDVAPSPPRPAGRATADEPAVSPVLLEIIRHRLNNINDDAASTLKRVSGSQIAVEASDLNTVIMAAGRPRGGLRSLRLDPGRLHAPGGVVPLGALRRQSGHRTGRPVHHQRSVRRHAAPARRRPGRADLRRRHPGGVVRLGGAPIGRGRAHAGRDHLRRPLHLRRGHPDGPHQDCRGRQPAQRHRARVPDPVTDAGAQRPRPRRADRRQPARRHPGRADLPALRHPHPHGGAGPTPRGRRAPTTPASARAARRPLAPHRLRPLP